MAFIVYRAKITFFEFCHETRKVPIFLLVTYILFLKKFIILHFKKANSESSLSGLSMNAEGEMYWDDGETIVDDFDKHPYYHFQFTVNATKTGTTVTVHRTHTSTKANLKGNGKKHFLGILMLKTWYRYLCLRYLHSNKPMTKNQ